MRKPQVVLLILAAALWCPAAARAQRAAFVVRHAEKVSDTDERLSEAGRTRAARLAAMLKEAGVAAIYSTDTERTKDTVTPLSDALKLPIQIYDIGSERVDAGPFLARLRREHATDVVVIVGHSNTVPVLLHALGCPGATSLARDEYDNLFVVVPKEKAATLVRLKY